MTREETGTGTTSPRDDLPANAGAIALLLATANARGFFSVATVDRCRAEYAALQGVERAAREALSAAQFRGHSAERRLLEIVPRLTRALEALAKVREVQP